MEKEEEYKKYAFYALLLILAYFFYLMIQPFTTYLVLGVVLAIAAYPMYERFLEKNSNPRRSAMLTILLALLIIVIPTLVISSMLLTETISFFSNMNLAFVNDIARLVTEVTGKPTNIESYVNQMLASAGQVIMNSTLNIIGSVSGIVIGLLIMFSVTYYLLIEGKEWTDKAKSFIPFSANQKSRLVESVKKVTKTVLYGEILIALIQGTLGSICFMIAGIPNPIFWGFVMAVLAFLPFVGTGFVWVPAGIIKMSEGHPVLGLFVLLFGTIIIGGIDYLLRPKIISGGSNIHPLTAMLGAFGGLSFFGVSGLILGPLLAAILEAFILFHYEDHQKKKEDETKNRKSTERKP